MPSKMKNTGISTLNELFAMKKNLAQEAKFEHRMYGIAKDYFHKKANLQQEIRNIYNELKSIKSSTGYSLDQVRSAERAGKHFRKPNAPTVYFPPVGIRLVKKYVGLDVKRQSLVGEEIVNSEEGRKMYHGLLTRTFGLGKRSSVAKTEDQSSFTEEFDIDNGEVDDSNAEQERIEHNDTAFTEATLPQTFLTEIFEQNTGNDNRDTSKSPQHTDRAFTTNKNVALKRSIYKKNSDIGPAHLDEFFAQDYERTNNQDTDTDKLTIDTCYNLSERRSSRSTFRTRNSARLLSRSSYLSNYNLEIVSQSKEPKSRGRTNGVKQKFGTLYLDYGDGKLHDNMEIPNIKDCSRPWCNPHCNTCKNRTTSRPCFILVPSDENVRKRKIPHDKRVSTRFPSYFGPSVGKSEKTDREGLLAQKDKGEGHASMDNSTFTENKEHAYDNNDQKTSGTEPPCEKTKTVTETTTSVNKEQEMEENELPLVSMKPNEKRGYSRRRLEELSQPRGGPPAEVRFSKMSLKKKQEQMIEKERTNALTEFEKHNLSVIQGKISMFLAFLNQQELKGKPPKMVDIPIREEIRMNENARKVEVKRKGNRNVRFALKNRPRLLS